MTIDELLNRIEAFGESDDLLRLARIVRAADDIVKHSDVVLAVRNLYNPGLKAALNNYRKARND